MSGIFTLVKRWLRSDRSSVGLRPHREFVVAIERDRVYAQARDAVERAIGANIVSADERTGTIEAAFGLVNHERLIVTLESEGEGSTRVTVEAFYPAGVVKPPRSHAVEVLADAIESGIRP
jgi:hypothetical protein